jgi:hypothetical protein
MRCTGCGADNASAGICASCGWLLLPDATIVSDGVAAENDARRGRSPIFARAALRIKILSMYVTTPSGFSIVPGSRRYSRKDRSE